MIPTARHRKCLEAGSHGGPNGENEAQLYTGDKVRQECLDQGWLERLPDSPAGFRMYRTTDLGRAKLREPLPEAKPTSKIKMLPPRIKTLDTQNCEATTAQR